MQKDPYVVLGVARDATQDQIERAYIELRDRYQSERFAEGAAGAHAARMLAEIEDAYNACMEDRLRDVHVSGGGGSYGDILQAIKENRLERAQEMLDGIEHSDAEWHYYQAAIYHKRNWNVESQKQLDIALTLDPSNEKYLKAKDNLRRVLETGAQQQGGSQTRAGYSRPDDGASSTERNANACCNTCSTLICCDCCCECMGGDLIPCC